MTTKDRLDHQDRKIAGIIESLGRLEKARRITGEDHRRRIENLLKTADRDRQIDALLSFAEKARQRRRKRRPAHPQRDRRRR